MAHLGTGGIGIPGERQIGDDRLTPVRLDLFLANLAQNPTSQRPLPDREDAAFSGHGREIGDEDANARQDIADPIVGIAIDDPGENVSEVAERFGMIQLAAWLKWTISISTLSVAPLYPPPSKPEGLYEPRIASAKLNKSNGRNELTAQ